MRLTESTLPHHFETVPVKPAISVPGWIIGIGCFISGVAIAISPLANWADIAGPALACFGAAIVMALVRCRHFEITVGDKLVTAGAGPFHRSVPVGAVEKLSKRPATSWRKLYADYELALTVTVSSGVVVIPSSDQEELVIALAEVGCPEPTAVST
jgi:hypothetical protein